MLSSLVDTYSSRGKLGHFLDFPSLEKFTKVVLDGEDSFTLTLEDGAYWLSNGPEDLELTKENVPHLPEPPLELVARQK